MSGTRKGFGDRLAALDHVTPTLKEKHDMELQAMFEKPVRGFLKWSFVLATVMGFGFTVLFGTVAVMAPAGFPLLGRLGFVAGAVFGVAWGVLGITVLRRGTVNMRSYPQAAAGIGWGFTVIMMTVFMVLAAQHPDRVAGVRMVVSGLAFLLMAAVFMVSARIEKSELKIREKLLEIEYRLAELGEPSEPGEPGREGPGARGQ